MYSSFKKLSAPLLLKIELPSLAASVIIAEMFYKLGSFTKEALAFLATWYVLGFAITKLNQFFGVKY